MEEILPPLITALDPTETTILGSDFYSSGTFSLVSPGVTLTGSMQNFTGVFSLANMLTFNADPSFSTDARFEIPAKSSGYGGLFMAYSGTLKNGITLGDVFTWIIGSDKNLDYAGVMKTTVDTATFIKDGSGTLTLSGANQFTHTGTTVRVVGGTLCLKQGEALGTPGNALLVLGSKGATLPFKQQATAINLQIAASITLKRLDEQLADAETSKITIDPEQTLTLDF